MRYMELTTFELYDELERQRKWLYEMAAAGANKFTLDSQRNRIKAIIFCLRKKKDSLF